MKVKRIYGSNNNFLDFTFDQGRLSVFFTGTPEKNFLFLVDDSVFINAVSQYLKNERFAFLEVNYNTLGFGNLNLRLFGENVFIFLKDDLEIKDYQKEEVYLSNVSDLILWAIVNAKEGFSIEKVRSQIQIEIAGKKNLN